MGTFNSIFGRKSSREGCSTQHGMACPFLPQRDAICCLVAACLPSEKGVLPRDNVLLMVMMVESITPSANNIVMMCTLHGRCAQIEKVFFPHCAMYTRASSVICQLGSRSIVPAHCRQRRKGSRGNPFLAVRSRDSECTRGPLRQKQQSRHRGTQKVHSRCRR